MRTTIQRQRVVRSKDVMPTSNVLLIDKRDGWTDRIRSNPICELQIATDWQWDAVVSVVWTIRCRSIRVAAVLHSVPEFVECLRRERRLHRRRPHVVAQAEWIGPANVRHRQTPLTSLPVMSILPGKCRLLLGCYETIDSHCGKISIVVILSAPRVAIAVEVGARNLSGPLRNFVVYGKNGLSDRIERSCACLRCGQDHNIFCPHYRGARVGSRIGAGE